MTLLRVGFLVLLWVFIYFVIRVLRRDLFGVRPSGQRSDSAQVQVSQPLTEAPPIPQPHSGPQSPGPSRVTLGPTRLVVTAGSLTGTQIPLATSAILIGRSPSCTLVLDDDYSSSRHARIFPRADTWFIEDLGSTNGTYVDSERVSAPMPLSLGSSVRVGQNTLELQR